MKGADFDPNGVLYGAEGGGGSDNTHLRFLVTINLTTGIGILIASIPVNNLDPMAFVPGRRVKGGEVESVKHEVPAL